MNAKSREIEVKHQKNRSFVPFNPLIIYLDQKERVIKSILKDSKRNEILASHVFENFNLRICS